MPLSDKQNSLHSEEKFKRMFRDTIMVTRKLLFMHAALSMHMRPTIIPHPAHSGVDWQYFRILKFVYCIKKDPFIAGISFFILILNLLGVHLGLPYPEWWFHHTKIPQNPQNPFHNRQSQPAPQKPQFPINAYSLPFISSASPSLDAPTPSQTIAKCIQIENKHLLHHKSIIKHES